MTSLIEQREESDSTASGFINGGETPFHISCLMPLLYSAQKKNLQPRLIAYTVDKQFLGASDLHTHQLSTRIL